MVIIQLILIVESRVDHNLIIRNMMQVNIASCSVPFNIKNQGIESGFVWRKDN